MWLVQTRLQFLAGVYMICVLHRLAVQTCICAGWGLNNFDNSTTYSDVQQMG